MNDLNSINNNINMKSLLAVNEKLNEISDSLLKLNKLNGLELYKRIDTFSTMSSFSDYIYTKTLSIHYFFQQAKVDIGEFEKYLEYVLDNFKDIISI